MNIGNWLSRIGLHAPQRPAILSGKDTLLTYGELHSRVAALSLALAQEFGVKKGDRVGLVANNHPHYFEVVFAAWYAGAVIVPVNAKLHASEAAWILKDSNCKLVFSDAAHSEALAAACGQAVINIASDQYDCLVATSATGLPADRAPDDTAWLFYTSGTTGKPKGVIITHRNLMAMTACFLADVSSIRDTDHWLYAAPASCPRSGSRTRPRRPGAGRSHAGRSW